MVITLEDHHENIAAQSVAVMLSGNQRKEIKMAAFLIKYFVIGTVMIHLDQKIEKWSDVSA